MGCYAIIFVSSLLTAFVSLATRSNILKKTMGESWMSLENFTALIEASYTTETCANIYICDQSAGTERIFKQFINIYPLEYTLNNAYEYCNNMFVVAASEESFLAIRPSIDHHENTEMLVVLDDVIQDPTDYYSTEANHYSLGTLNFLKWMYIDVNIAARNCLGTLTATLFHQREFKTVTRYSDMVHRKFYLDFQGEMLQVSTIYSPPYCYLKSTVNVTEGDVRRELFFNESEFDGVELKIFLLFAERLNFKYEIRKPIDGYRYGIMNETSRTLSGGVMGQMETGSVSVAFGSIWYTLDNWQSATLTTPWKQFHMGFLVPRPKPRASLWALTTPLSRGVWVLVITTLIAQSLYIYTRAMVNPRIPKRFRSFTRTWIEMMGRLIGTCAPNDMQGLKVLLTLWHFIGILMITAYSSSLAALLASREYDKRIDTLRDFIEANLTWGMEGLDKPSMFFDMSDPYAKQFPDRYEHETSEADRHEKILKGNYAILGHVVDSSFFPYDSIRMEDLKDYRLMKESVSSYFATFAIYDPMLEPMNTVLLQLQENGLVQYHLTDVLSRRTEFGLREVIIERDIGIEDDAKVLELKPLAAGFFLYLIGISISTIVFYFELKSAKGSRSIREVLRDIQRNRESWYAEKLKRQRMHSILMKLKEKKCVSGVRRKIVHGGLVIKTK